MLVAPGPIGGAGKGLQAVFHFRVTAGDVHRRLLITHHDVLKIRVLLERLADPGNVAMPEDAQHAGKEGILYAIAFNILVLEEPDQCLGSG